MPFPAFNFARARESTTRNPRYLLSQRPSSRGANHIGSGSVGLLQRALQGPVLIVSFQWYRDRGTGKITGR
jgi:hypothetical protein